MSIKEYLNLTEVTDLAIVAGHKQYLFGAQLIAKHMKKPGIAGPDTREILQNIQAHFAHPDKHPEYVHPETGIKIGRYVGTGIDVSHGNKNIEVVGGGGKMFGSKRGIFKSQEGANDLLTVEADKDFHLVGKILRSGIARGELHGETTRRRLATPTEWPRLTTPHEHEGTQYKGLFRREDGHNVAMKHIEEHMASNGITHWGIGKYLIPIGNLSKFVSNVSVTQKKDKRPGEEQVVPKSRLALRVGGIVDPHSETGQKIGSERNWHNKLNTMLDTWDSDKLKYHGIEKIADHDNQPV